MLTLRLLETAVIGFVAGVLSGAFGIGGGVVTTPAIKLLLGAPALIAVGTPLPVIIPSAITGAVSYARRGVADVRAGIIAGLAGALLAIAGAWLTTIAGGTVVLAATGLLIVYTAIDMVVQVLRPRAALASDTDEAAAETRETQAPVGALVLIGAAAGFASGFLGLGGGFVIVPLLTRWLGFPIKRAIATSLVTISLLAIPGTITHAFLGHVDWLLALGLTIGVIPGAMLGAHLTLGAGERAVRIAFAVLLGGVGVLLLVTTLMGA